jgi:hypothetical protein
VQIRAGALNDGREAIREFRKPRRDRAIEFLQAFFLSFWADTGMESMDPIPAHIPGMPFNIFLSVDFLLFTGYSAHGRKFYPLILIAYCLLGLLPKANVMYSNTRTVFVRDFQLNWV